MPEITYLTDRDAGGFFTEAEGYFAQRADAGSTVREAGAEPWTIGGVLADLRLRAEEGETYPVVNLVAHGTAFGALQVPISDERRTDDGGITTLDQLRNAVTRAGSSGYPPVLGPPAVTAATKVCLYGCDVGRDARFLALLGQLFGPEVTVYAPLRMAVFRHTGTTVEHRLARSWSTPYSRDLRTATDWPAIRADVGAKLEARFPAASADIQAAIGTATATPGPTYFWSGGMDLAGDPSAVTPPLQVSSAVVPGASVDDTTVPLTLTAADFRESGGVWSAWVATLGQVIEEPVSLENPAHYRRTVLRPARAAARAALVPEREPGPVPDGRPGPRPGPGP